MTVSEARDAIMTKFNTDWANETPIAWDNLDYNSNNEFVRVSMQHNLGFQASVGAINNNMFRKLGLIYVQIFTKLKESANRNDILAEKALNIFKYNAGNVWFRNQQVNYIGRDSEGKFYQQNVTAEFIYDSIK